MKPFQRSQRRTAASKGPGVSLFPFLAVLICTMGALVPLLLAITRTARLQAEAEAVAKAAEAHSTLTTDREDAQWRTEQLKQSREQTEAQAADARLELGHLEDHGRRLRNKLAQYERTFRELDRIENADQRQRDESRAELVKMAERIDSAKQEIENARQAATGRNRCYAVVPYDGPNQTRRRPIYLECRADSVVLQPEGIELSAADFNGPLGPGNPLASALRAAREYMLSQKDFDPKAGEPYPMLLVRPEGINAYYAARAAMKSWGFDFGYELVDDSWRLAFPPPDARLAEDVRQVVASARVNQARIAAAAPRHYGRPSKAAYRASPNGGFVRVEGSAAADDEPGGYATAPVAGAVGHGAAPGFGTRQLAGGGRGTGAVAAVPNATDGPALTSTSAGGFGGGAPGGDPRFAASGNDRSVGELQSHADPNGSDGSGFGGSGNPYRSSGDFGDGPGASSSGGSQVAANPYRPASGSGGNATSAGRSPSYATAGLSGDTSKEGNGGAPGRVASVERPEGYVAGQPAHEREPSNGRPETSGDDATRTAWAPRPGEWQPAPDPPPERRPDPKDEHPRRSREKCVAEKRGTDWSLRDAARGSVGVTRPVRVECYADRLVIISDRGPAANRVIPLGQRTGASIDAFISAVWEHMEGWGIAGRSMYWRPVLHVYVASDAEQRFADLSVLLEDSGMKVTRK
jgi:hypothetical protein